MSGGTLAVIGFLLRYPLHSNNPGFPRIGNAKRPSRIEPQRHKEHLVHEAVIVSGFLCVSLGPLGFVVNGAQKPGAVIDVVWMSVAYFLASGAISDDFPISVNTRFSSGKCCWITRRASAAVTASTRAKSSRTVIVFLLYERGGNWFPENACGDSDLAGLAAQAASAFHWPRATRRPGRKGFGRDLATRLRTSGGRGQTGRFPRSPGFPERESGCPLHPVAVSVSDGKRPVWRPRFPPGFRPSTSAVP